MLEKLEVKESIYIYCFTFTHQLLTRHAMWHGMPHRTKDEIELK